MSARLAWRIAAAAWAVVIAVSGLLPTQGAVHAIAEGHDSLVTTAGHFAAYVLLGFLLAVGLNGGALDLRTVVLTLALATTLGVVIEIVQIPLSYRDGQVSDAVVDVAGAAAGLLLLSGVERSRGRRGGSRPG